MVSCGVIASDTSYSSQTQEAADWSESSGKGCGEQGVVAGCAVLSAAVAVCRSRSDKKIC